MTTSTITGPSTLDMIYECSDCGERTSDRRCQDCNLFTRRLGAGGHCPHCDEPVLVEELLNPEKLTTPTTPSHNLTGSPTWTVSCGSGPRTNTVRA